MSNFYIYGFHLSEGESGFERKKTIAVIFCPREDIDEIALKEELKLFYEHNYIPDELHVIGGQYLIDQLTSVFITQESNVFQVIPKMPNDFSENRLWVYAFNENGKLTCIHNTSKKSVASYVKFTFMENLKKVKV